MILQLPQAERQVAAEEAVERHRTLVKLLAIERLLLAGPDADTVLDNPGFMQGHEDNRQQLVAEYFIRSSLPPLEDITEAASEAMAMAGAFLDDEDEDDEQ